MAALAIVLFGVAPVHGAFVGGDVLLNNFSGANVEQISAAGALKHTFTGTGGFWVGAALTPDAKLVTVHRSPDTGVNIFLADGTEQSTFTFINPVPGDAVVFADGTIAVSALNSDRVDLYNQAGASLGFISKAGMDRPFGLALAVDDTLWIASLNSQDLTHLAQNGTDLGGFSLGFDPGDVVVDPTDGTLWVSERSSTDLHHYTVPGASLGSFTTAVTGNFDGLGIASDGTLHVTGSTSTSIFRYSSAGLLLGSLPIDTVGGQPFRLAVVPVPEPSALVEAGFGLLIFVAVRRRRNWRL